MATRLQIRCINKDSRNDPHKRIAFIGGVNVDGTPWKITEEAAIEGMRKGSWTFHVTVAGQMVDVVIAISQFGHLYLRTVADEQEPNNLLALPECP